MPWSPLWRLAQTRSGGELIDRAVARGARAATGIIPPKPPFFDVRTPEYTVFPTAQRHAWECVRGIDRSFGHNEASREDDFLRRDELLWSFVDIASKGGNLLLNVGPRGEDATDRAGAAQTARLAGRVHRGQRSGALRTRPWVQAEGSAHLAEIRYTALLGPRVHAFVRPAPGVPAVSQVTLTEIDAGPASTVSDVSGARLVASRGARGLVVSLGVPATGDRPVAVVVSSATARPTPA